MPPSTRGFNPNGIDTAITLWNESRCIPLGRPNYDKILEQLGILSNSEILPYSYLCSLTDCYWFKQPDNSINWESVNFHNNGFSSNLYKHLFYNEFGEPINNLNSPDLTTDGALPKMWRQESNGDFSLLKGYKGASIEACCEIIADNILDELGIEHVHYQIDFDEQHNITSSVCKNFITSDKEEFIPVENLMRDYNCVGHENFLSFLYDMGFKEKIELMMLGDSIIGNLDRHARNYGIVINSDTQQIQRFAPLFDHGGCFLGNNHGFLTYPPTGVSFNKTIPMIPKEKFELLEYINMDKIHQVIMGLPMKNEDKYNIIFQLDNRIDKLISFGERNGYDLDRK